MSDMRAALYDSYGPPDVLYVGTVPRPDIKDDEVLVHVLANSINGGEVMMRAGRLKLIGGRKFPKRIGLDFAGEIVEVGPKVTDVSVGDRVWGIISHFTSGAAAEYVAVKPERFSPLPEGLDIVESVSLLAGGTTAITGLRDKARLEPGERLLVRGGTGGVGFVAVQLGKAMGAHVTALVSAQHLDTVRELGADEALDYRVTKPADLGQFDVIFDTVGDDLGDYRKLLAKGGRMVAVAMGREKFLGNLLYIVASSVYGKRRVRFFSGDPKTPLFLDLTGYVERGVVHPLVDTIYPLEEIAEAHRKLDGGGVRGKVVLRTT